mgnify:CR=1 FL=1|tara:strand:- start:1528 stop:2814 length:1287 start_codon:yes stop_codon:yes gene_type:complete
MINVGFGQFEKTEKEIGSSYDNIATGFFEAQKANIVNTWNYNPSMSLWRKGQEFDAYNQDNTLINRDELNEKYGSLGLNFKEDTRKTVVDYLVQQKEKEIQRSETVAKGPQNIFAKSSYFLTSLGTSFLDPINIGASFVPVIGQAKFAGMVARSGKNIARMKKGFVEGLVGNLAVEPIVYGVHRSQQSDYDQYDAFINVAAGGLIGAKFQLGFGKLGDYIAKVRGKPNIYQRLAAVSPENQQALLKYTIGKHLRGEKVDTGDLIVNRSRTGDKQLNELDDQIANFKKLYTDALKKGDRKSAKIYIQNIRNLQRTERQLFEAKKNANDQAVEKERAALKQRDETGAITREQLDLREKNTSQLENEAELLNQRQKLHQKQLDVKDEDLDELEIGINQDRAEIQKIDNNIKNKTTIRDAIRAGANCVKRGT